MFYFTPSKIASFFRSSCPSLTEYVQVSPRVGVTLADSPPLQVGTPERRLQRLAVTRGRRINQDERAHVVCA